MNVFLKKVIPYLSPLVVLGIFEFSISVPTFLLWSGITLTLVVFLSVWYVVYEKLRGAGMWLLIVLCLVFVLSGGMVILFFEQDLTRHLFSMSIMLVYAVLLHNIYAFLWEPHRYQPYAIENISRYVNILSVFFLVTSFAMFRLLTNFSVWPLAPILGALLCIITLQTLWAQKVPLRRALGISALFGLGIAELAVAVNYLPVRPLVQAGLVAVPYYFFISLTHDWLKQQVDRVVVQRLSLYSLLLIILICLTAQWQ